MADSATSPRCNTIVPVNETEAVKLVAEAEAAWNIHDMTRFSRLFAEDADFVNVGGWWWRGRDEIEQNHAALHESIFKDSSMALVLAGVKVPAPGVAVLHVKWQMSGHHRSGVEQTTNVRRGVWSWVVVERDTATQIVSAHNTDTMAVPPRHPLSHLTPR